MYTTARRHGMFTPVYIDLRPPMAAAAWPGSLTYRAKRLCQNKMSRGYRPRTLPVRLISG
jgi:hypothetical protein